MLKLSHVFRFVFVLMCANFILWGCTKDTSSKPRLLVLTDIGGDPDDQQAMIRLMLYSNEIDIEGLVASASGTPGELEEAVVKPQLIEEIVNAYGNVRDDLIQHDPDYPDARFLLQRIKSGNPQRGVDAVGEGNDTEGSNWIISIVDKRDPRPLYISIWGGQTDLAQALWRVKKDRGQKGYIEFVSRIRIYDIADQDGIYDWMMSAFPDLWYILNKSAPGEDKRTAVFRGMYLGGDELLTSRDWIDTFIRQNHGPLGALYPTKTWTAPNPHGTMKEGDTPSWFYILENGLNEPDFPHYGGWGGRFQSVKTTLFRDAEDLVDGEQNGRATVWRWRQDFQNDFAARMDWCVNGYAKANHHPVVQVAGERFRSVRSGKRVVLDATKSHDPDGDELSFEWLYYPEAGSFKGDFQIENIGKAITSFVAPVVEKTESIHIIARVNDKGQPELTRYKRIIVSIEP